jgi:polar amino acid transport system substrate-binding protein
MNLLKALISFSFLEAFALLVGATVLVGVIIWMIERRHTEHFSGGVRQGLTTSMLWSAKTLTQSMPEQGPTTLIGRLIAVMWLAAAVTTIAVFTAGLTTHLTTRELRGYVRGVRDLLSVRVGAVANSAALVYLKAERIRFRPYASLDAGLKAVKAGTLDAFVYDKPCCCGS